jgi:beta-N-acetylhexosaminidase
MEKARARRRRLALGTLAVLAVGGFAVGAVAGGGSAGSGRGRAEARCAGEAKTTRQASGQKTTAGQAAARCRPGEGEGGAAAESHPTLAESLRPGELAAERVVVSVDGTGITPGLRAVVREGKVAGVVLFEADFPTRAAGRELIDDLQAIPRPGRLAHLPLLVMTDQEGGEVKRVDGPPEASAAAIGREGATYARRQGRATAANLGSLGVTVDLAPVLDVARPGGVIAATKRGFGATAAAVTETAIPFAAGLQAGGVAATAKHFPGLGTATENTDFEAQDLALSKRELRAVDEAPYRAYIAAAASW